MVWGAFTGFEKSLLVFMPQGKQSATDFVRHVYEDIFFGFYFMHDASQQLIFMEESAPMHRNKFLIL